MDEVKLPQEAHLILNITSKFGREILRELTECLDYSVVQYKPTAATVNNERGYGIRFDSVSLEDKDTWKVGDPSKVYLKYYFVTYYPNPWHRNQYSWKYDVSADTIATFDQSPTMLKQILITTLVRSAFTNERVGISFASYSGGRYNKIDIPALHHYIEDDEHHFEDLDFLNIEINRTKNMHDGDFNSYFKDGVQEKLLLIDCPINTRKSATKAKAIEIIAFIYALKGLSKEFFIEKYGNQFARYWDKAGACAADVFLTTAANEANDEIEKLYDELLHKWNIRVEAAQIDINNLEKEIADKRSEFDRTIKAEFERTVIDPLKQKQKECIEKCKDEKPAAVENLRDEIKKCKAAMQEDIQKKVQIQSLLHIPKKDIKIRNETFTI